MSSLHKLPRTGLITLSIISLEISSWEISGACCVEITIVSIFTGLLFSYLTDTWDLPSGLTHGKLLFFLTSANFFVSFWDNKIGMGINSSVSFEA